ncbi:MAG: hypothetical protein IKC89_00430 [Lentisphaeria bacterium]|nr:hypothetical protein [Lentisphaeria bacterium]
MKAYIFKILFTCSLTVAFLFTLNLYATTYRVKERTTASGSSEYEVTEVTRASGSGKQEVVDDLMRRY